MLFLGRGCSRCFKVVHYNGFEESTIYFLDDDMVVVPSADDGMMYSFTDMDKIGITSWPKGLYQHRSDNAPPTWWLH